MLLDAKHILVHVTDVVAVREDKGFLWVETEGQNVLDVVLAHLERTFRSVELNFWLVDIFLVISDLDHKGDIEDSLQPLCENERDAMTHVECISRGTSTCVQIERLFVLVGSEDLLKVTLAEKDSTSDEPVSFLTDSSLQAFNELRSDGIAAVLLNELIVIDTSIRLGSDFEWGYDVVIISRSCSCSCLYFFNHFK